MGLGRHSSGPTEKLTAFPKQYGSQCRERTCVQVQQSAEKKKSSKQRPQPALQIKYSSFYSQHDPFRVLSRQRTASFICQNLVLIVLQVELRLDDPESRTTLSYRIKFHLGVCKNMERIIAIFLKLNAFKRST